MGAEQSLVGGRKRSRSIESNTGSKRNNYEAYKAVKSMLEEQGKDFDKQVFLDLPDIRVLKRLGIFEECDIGRFDNEDCKNSIKNIVINAHGSLVTNATKGIDISLVVPDNIVVLFMGELGYLTWDTSNNVTKDICNKELVPNQIGLPRSTIPNVSLSKEYQEGHHYSTGIFDCELGNPGLNQLKGFEHYLIPTEENITESMEQDVKEMLQKATTNGKKIIKKITLSEILSEISKKIPKDKYGFVYVFSCLGGVCSWKTKEEIEVYTKPKGLSSVRGYTIKKIPARAEVSRFSIGDDSRWNPVMTNDKDVIFFRNWFVNNYDKVEDDEGDKEFIDTFIDLAFVFDENWRDHLPDINSKFIIQGKNIFRKNAFENHFNFIDLLYEGNEEKIRNFWDKQFQDKSKFLLPRRYYLYYSEKRNLNYHIISFLKENKEIFENIQEYYKSNKNIEEKIYDLAKKKDIETLKSLLYDYMKNIAINLDYWSIYEKLRDEGYDKNMQNMIYMHWTYDDLIRTGEEAGTEDFVEGLRTPGDNHYEEKENYKNALDIMPYIDYVNSDEYVHVEKDYVIETMNEIRDALGFNDVQQGRQVGRVQQYGGMWQRGGFFMTCS